ncbi:hypothetical protein IWQ62_000970 [Dispira parvispora]|uniref:Mss4-like protein n=1 Tax=Dispira parvispora TaxID=1520584 RepID=A0A9W8E932_9FUNG|nr:hypothetical protein IWQ62_000970 [Dispira parvispora]
MADQVTFDTLSDQTTGGKNLAALYCPRPGCRCLLLKPNVAQLTTPADEPIAELTNIPTQLLAGCNLTTQPDNSTYFWKVTNMLDFENLGFLKTVAETGVKYLSCPDCDLAPLGFHNTHSQLPQPTYFLAADRVRYQFA